MKHVMIKLSQNIQGMPVNSRGIYEDLHIGQFVSVSAC